MRTPASRVVFMRLLAIVRACHEYSLKLGYHSFIVRGAGRVLEAAAVFGCLLVAIAGEFDAPIDTRKHVGFPALVASLWQHECSGVLFLGQVCRLDSNIQNMRLHPIARAVLGGSKTTVIHHEAL